MKLATRRTSAAVAAMATVGVSSLFGAVAPAAAAPGDACGPGGVLLSPGVCELRFTSGTGTFTPTAQMTKLEVLLVGAGGAGADQPTANGYAAGGGGGEVKVVDFSGATAPLTLTVPASGVPGSISDGTTTATVGNGGDAPSGGVVGASSGNGNAGATGTIFSSTPYGAGGGAGSIPANNADGGAGVVVSTLVTPASLFGADSTCYGGGGAVGISGVQGIPGCGAGGPADTTGATLAAAVANSGGGGGGVSTTQSAALRSGADGVVAVRWNGATATLAFDANGHGSAPASQTVVAGTAAARPVDPTAEGYAFRGWYTDAALTTVADFSAPVTGATTYFAAWDATLAASGATLNPAEIPLAAGALALGIGFVVVASRRRRRLN